MQSAVDKFNATCPVGSAVDVRLDSGEVKRTTVRQPASILGGHTPVAWLDGIAGAYDLSRVTAAANG